MSDNLDYVAKIYFDKGDYPLAELTYAELIKAEPHRKDLYIAYGNCLDLNNKKIEALKAYKKALKIDKKFIPAYVNLSTSFYELGNYKKSQKYAQKVLKLDSKNVSALVNLGNISYRNRDYNKAMEFYKSAYDYNPNYFTAVVNIANTYCDFNDYKQAVLFAQKAIKLDSKNIQPYLILGNAFLELDDGESAANAFEKALKINPADAWIYNSLSQAYQKKGLIEEAMNFGFSALEKAPEDDAQHINFGYLLYEAFNEKFKVQTIEFAKKWLECFPENKIAQHMGNALVNYQKVPRANDEYLKNIFDVFADDFDEVLAALDYKAPDYIQEVMSRIYNQKSKYKLRILDAGCGTGLCGKFLKNHAGWRGLQGVDISKKMLENAKHKKLYDKLFEMELISFLSHKKDDYDLIVSSDVFTYFGDLKELFSYLASALKNKGRLIFTVSENDEDSNAYFLHPSGRYLHACDYIKTTLENAGFFLENMERKKLRNEGNNAVFGFVVSAQKI